MLINRSKLEIVAIKISPKNFFGAFGVFYACYRTEEFLIVGCRAEEAQIFDYKLRLLIYDGCKVAYKREGVPPQSEGCVSVPLPFSRLRIFCPEFYEFYPAAFLEPRKLDRVFIGKVIQDLWWGGGWGLSFSEIDV